MGNEPARIQRASRVRQQEPASVPRPVEHQPNLVTVDTTWGQLQPLQCASGVVTVGELELVEQIRGGAALVDRRVPDSRGGISIPGAVNSPHARIMERRNGLNPSRLSVFFGNGPQCPQSPAAIRKLLDAGYPASALAYYRGGMHDWVTLAMPTGSVS